MQFIESIAGASPDGGSGALELGLLLLLFLSTALAAAWKRRIARA